jgi:hypothetical protein
MVKGPAVLSCFSSENYWNTGRYLFIVLINLLYWFVNVHGFETPCVSSHLEKPLTVTPDYFGTGPDSQHMMVMHQHPVGHTTTLASKELQLRFMNAKHRDKDMHDVLKVSL